MLFSKKKKFKGGDRRKSARLDVHHLVKHKVGAKEEELSFARNISADGECFVAKENIPVGTLVGTQINFPHHPGPIKATAKVIWTKELKKLGCFKVGAEFVDMPAEEKDFINKEVTSVSENIKK